MLYYWNICIKWEKTNRTLSVYCQHSGLQRRRMKLTTLINVPDILHKGSILYNFDPIRIIEDSQGRY